MFGFDVNWLGLHDLGGYMRGIPWNCGFAVCGRVDII